MSEQLEKKENVSEEESLSEAIAEDEGPVPKQAAEPSSSKGGVEENESSGDAGDLSGELDGFLDDSDEFQEIDLFDEGLLDDVNAENKDGPAVSQAESGTDDPAADAERQVAASEPTDAQSEARVEEGEPEASAVSSMDIPEDDLAAEIAADIAVDLQQDTGDAPVSDMSSSEPEQAPAKEQGSPDAAADLLSSASGSQSDEDVSVEITEKGAEAGDSVNDASTGEPEIELEPVDASMTESGPGDLPEAPEVPDTDGERISEEDNSTKPGSSGTDTDAFGDDLGISLSDDELWDDSSDDDIPLFDDEPEDTAPADQEEQQATEQEHLSDEDSTAASVAAALAAENVATGPDGTSEPGSDVSVSQSSSPAQGLENEDIIVVGGSGPAWLPYFISGFASVILLGGIFVLWGMLSAPSGSASPEENAALSSKTHSSAQDASGQQARPSAPSDQSSSPSSDQTPLGDVRPIQGGQNFETFNLAPFIIPVMRQGELVFFKLTVELIVPDMKTKQQLKKREAWVRDAIYTELKGIEVGPGTKGEFLLNYRRPLKQRIEKELAPLEIRDVRLMGYVLK